MLDMIVQGGPVMIPILLLSVVALALIVERFLAFLRRREGRPDLTAWTIAELNAGRGLRAAEELASDASPVAAVLREGIAARTLPTEERSLRMQACANRELDALERNLSLLSSIANIETLLGLLGTVTGMIRSFISLRLSGVADPAVLAGGIAEALITTAAGLIVAVPCLVAWHVLTQSVDRATARVEAAATELQVWYAARGVRR